MGKRTADQSIEEVKREMWNRWRILIRRTDFQKDIRAFRELCLQNAYTGAELRGLKEKYGIEGLSQNTLSDPTFPPLSMRSIKEYETLFQEYPSPISHPVLTFDPYYEVEEGFVPHPRYSWPGKILAMEIDLSYPLTDLMNLIEEEVRYAIMSRSKKVPSASYLPASRARHRTNLLTKQLEVFDLYMNGESTKHISRLLRRPLGTVRSQLRTALDLTRYERQHASNKLWERKHLKKCSVCKRKKRVDEDCPEVAKRYRLEYETNEHSFKEWTKAFLPPCEEKD